ncbi:SDR family NAD(P)-dependent oxidoreductase [Paraburkholderia xenovorans]|uniref:SDR family NAD(P)-dependent oxidoreductase n=1 Tax=Paraburkholderia xenovorans TaxID=36873 RepID=UPI0038B99095
MNRLPSFRLDGRITVVTGGGSGIGRAAAHMFASAGATVVVLDSNGAAASDAADEIGSSADSIATDVTNPVAVKEVFDEIADRYGRIDVLFNNAGINRRRDSMELSLEDWNAVIAVNMTGMLLCARSAAKHMTKGGSIVNTASVLGLSGGWFPNIAYQASKGAVVNMTRSWAVEWASYHIRVNAIAPSIVRTPFTSALTEQPDFVAKFESLTPLGRLCEPEDMVGAVLFLASDASSMVTGHILPIDGGMLAQ